MIIMVVQKVPRLQAAKVMTKILCGLVKNAIIKNTDTSDNYGCSNSPQIADWESNHVNIMWFCEECQNENTHPYW